MVASGTLELAKNIETRQASFPLGSLVEVTYTNPDLLSSYTYLGTVAMRPEDKARMSVLTNKLGGEHIIPMAETYTIKTQTKTRHDHLPAEEGVEQQRVSTAVHPADLIFDPTYEAFSIVQVEPAIPAPR